jgi:hypothetical protein
MSNINKKITIKLGDCNIVPGGIKANMAHFEKLLAEAGMKPADFTLLFKNSAARGGLARLSAMRVELHLRGILPLARLAGTPGAPTVATTAALDVDVPPELERQISEVAQLANTLAAALPGMNFPQNRAATPAPAIAHQVEGLRAELKALLGKNDDVSARRKVAIGRLLKQKDAGSRAVSINPRTLKTS